MSSFEFSQTPGFVACVCVRSGHKVDVADSTTAVRAADASKPTESTVYRISLFDGSAAQIGLDILPLRRHACT